MMRGYSKLLRPCLSLLNGVTAAAGYLLYPAPVEMTSLVGATVGVVLLAAGASALNQVMERDIDALMARTRCRPLPQGHLTPTSATAIGGASIAAGTGMLFAAGGFLLPLLGIVALAWYLVVYTPLKRRTPLAILPGAICGAVPPIIGWCVAGGDPADFRIILFAGLLYIWQIPHFQMVQRRHADDYRRAGIPLCCDRLSAWNASLIWLVALVSTAMLLPALGIIGSHGTFWSAVVSAPVLLASVRRFEPAALPYLNLFPLAITALLAIQK